MAKLSVFDLGATDGIFRVAVCILVGLALVGMGASYAPACPTGPAANLRM
jgi:hypothetical protein